MPDRGLDEEKLETLARWASGLRNDERAEVAAAGRAIEMLIEEIEHLHVLLWDKTLSPPEPPPAPASAAADVDFDVELRNRLARRLPGFLQR